MNYFKTYDLLKNQAVKIMNPLGEIILSEYIPNVEDETILKAYQLMNYSRCQDDIQNKMQRQGRLLSFLTSTGQEACEVAYTMVLRPQDDFYCSGYRNSAAWLGMGIPSRNIMLYWIGNENGAKAPDNIKCLPPNIVIGTQYSQATGIAFANKYLKKDSVVVVTTGDGGTSEGETYEAMNFAKLHELPIIFICENNHFAISTPISKQTKAINFAIKSYSSGIPSLVVDGNDFLACYEVMLEAVEYVKNNGPVFIEMDTYRLGAHSSSDSPDVYRDKAEFEAAKLNDPLIRLKNYLVNKGIWSEEKQTALDQEQNEKILREFEWVEANRNYPLEEIFDFQYEKKDLFLEEQFLEAKTWFSQHPLKEGE